MNQTNQRQPQRRAHTLTPEQRRRVLEMRRRQKRKKQLMIGASLAAVLVLSVVLGLTLPAKGGHADQTASARTLEVNANASAEPGADAEGTEATEGVEGVEGAEGAETAEGAEGAEGASAEPGASAAATVAPTPEPTQTPEPYVPEGGVFVFDDAYEAAATGKNTGPVLETDFSKVDPAKINRWPKVESGYIPILYHASNVEEKVLAITVDDCFQADNLRQIVQCALDNNGKLTIFPIGDNLSRPSVAEVVKWAWQNGMEIENHTYNHVGMYHFDDERMAKEIWMQNMILNQVLGVNYTEHFFRPKGGDEREDQRVHAYVNQMGMYGIAIWTASGSSSAAETIISNFGPGHIYLYHTTDKDLGRLLQVIPEATRQGYRLVTLNELFGLPDNETSELTAVSDPPALQPFKIEPALLRKTTYIRAAAVVQKRLIELGWMDGEADGVFGQSSFMGTGYFQLAADLKADGKAGAATQAVLFSEDAPAATSENRAKVKAKMNK